MSRIFGESSKNKVSIIAANFFGIPEALASWVRQDSGKYNQHQIADMFEMGYREPPNIIYKAEQHNCKDGSYGFADFIGFRKVEDRNESD